MFATLRLLIFFLAAIGLSSCDPGSESGPSGSVPQMDDVRNSNTRMKTQLIQVAAEHYAADHGTDQYPTQIDDEFKSYMPGGREGIEPSKVGVVNEFTGVNQFPILGNLKDVHSVRYGPRFPMGRGEISYSPLNNGKGYALICGAGDGKVMMDEKNPGQVLVFSNYED